MKINYILVVLMIILLFFEAVPSNENIFPDDLCSLNSSKNMKLNRNPFNNGPGKIINEKAGSVGSTLASIDYDGDNDLDYIEGSFNEIIIVDNNRGEFQKKLFYILDDFNGYPESLDYGAIASEDLNNDGQEDFITGGKQGFVRIFINNDSSSLNPHFDMYEINKFGQAIYGLTVYDFNNDGWMDFAVSSATKPFNYSIISIFYNQKDLSFSRQDIFYFDNYYIKDLEAGDFDNDGDVDLLFSYSKSIWHGDLLYNLIGVYSMLENKDGMSFGKEQVIAERGRDIFLYFGSFIYITIQVRIRHFFGLDRFNPHLTCADYDEDGDLDFIVGDNSGKIELFINDGNSDFTSSGVLHRYGHISWGLTSGDFDGDNDIDFLVAANNKYGDIEGHIWLKENTIS